MNDLREIYFNIERSLFPMVEEELGELSEKMREFLRLVESVQPARFITGTLCWSGLGRPMESREKMLRAFFMKAVYNLPTTKALIENLETNPSWRRLCGWEHRTQVPSAATFSRAFAEFAGQNLLTRVQEAVLREKHKGKLVGHASMDSTAIVGRERACRKNTTKKELAARGKKKRGRKSKAEKAALAALAPAEDKTRRLELQPGRSLAANLADLPQGCDWGGKQNSKGKAEFWCGYKLHLTFGDGGVPLAAIMTSASPHDSQVAIPLMQMTSERANVLYDLADSAYDAPEIHEFSRTLGRVPVIDPNKRRGNAVELDPAKKIRFRERTTAERGNSDLKDNYGARHVRVKGHLKVFCHLMFGVIALTVKQLFNLLN
jgi:transposase